jgi:hypothetical protein
MRSAGHLESDHGLGLGHFGADVSFFQHCRGTRADKKYTT